MKRGLAVLIVAASFQPATAREVGISLSLRHYAHQPSSAAREAALDLSEHAELNAGIVFHEEPVKGRLQLRIRNRWRDHDRETFRVEPGENYIQLQEPIMLPLQWKAGRMTHRFGRGLLLDDADDDWLFDGAVSSLEHYPYRLEIMAAAVAEPSPESPIRSVIYSMVEKQGRPGRTPGFNIGAGYFEGADRDLQTAGGALHFNMAPGWLFEAEAHYQFSLDQLNRQAWLGRLLAAYTHREQQFDLELRHTSGSASERFNVEPLFGRQEQGFIFNPDPGNLQWMKAGYRLKRNEVAWHIRGWLYRQHRTLAYDHQQVEREFRGWTVPAGGPSNWLGAEADAGVSFNVTRAISAELEIGAFFPGTAYAERDPAYAAMLELVWFYGQ